MGRPPWQFLTSPSVARIAGPGRPLSVRFCLLDRHMAMERDMRCMNCAHRSWDLPDFAVTPEEYYWRRREFLRVFGLGLAASAVLPLTSRSASTDFRDSLNPN